MIRILFLTLAVALVASPAFAAGSLHTWSFISYIETALKPVVGAVDAALPAALRTQGGIAHVIMFTIVCVFLAIAGAVIGAGYKKKLESGDLAPSPSFSFANVIETIVGMVLSLLDEIVGHGSKKYLTLIGSLALVILFNNLFGLIPGMGLATSNLNTTVPLALIVFLAYHYYGMRAHGVFKYLEHFMGPLEGGLKYAMSPIMIPIELISHAARPMSLSLRLFGNMFGDHTIFGVFMVGLGISLPLIYPLPFLVLGALVCIVQALVFCLLSMVYLSLATESGH